MSTGPARAPKKIPVLPLVAGVVVLGVLAFLIFRKLDYRALEAQGLALIRGAGPWAFFGAAALLPAVGAPLSAFTITSAELFAPTLTLPGSSPRCSRRSWSTWRSPTGSPAMRCAP